MNEITTPLAKEVYHALDCFLDDTSKTQTFDLFKRENFRLALKVQELELELAKVKADYERLNDQFDSLTVDNLLA